MDDDLELGGEEDFETIQLRHLRWHFAKLSMVQENSRSDGFTEEFNRLERESERNGLGYTSSEGEKEANKKKNRYGNVMPWDHTRVHVRGGDGEADYINANYITHVGGGRKYIASQGPLSATEKDFWRMVWSEKVEVVVMLTRLRENERVKCHHYWPKGDTETYGRIEVKLLDSRQIINDLVRVRRFELRHLDEEEAGVHTVLHYQYEEWPDHGTPECTDTFRSLLSEVDKVQSKQEVPIVVHCSAGIGRTGTFCAVHSTLHEIRASPESGEFEFNLPKRILDMRKDRAGMVQTKEQYEFCYAAILHSVEQEFPTLLSDESPQKSATTSEAAEDEEGGESDEERSGQAKRKKAPAFSLSSDEDESDEEEEEDIKDRYRRLRRV